MIASGEGYCCPQVSICPNKSFFHLSSDTRVGDSYQLTSLHRAAGSLSLLLERSRSVSPEFEVRNIEKAGGGLACAKLGAEPSAVSAHCTNLRTSRPATYRIIGITQTVGHHILPN